MQKTNDRAVTIKTVEINVEGLGQTIQDQGLTVERMVALSYDPKKNVFQLTYQDGNMKARDKMNFQFMRSDTPSILTWIKVNGSYFFETINMDEDTLKTIAPFFKQLDGVRDAKGHTVDEVYFVGANANIARQHVLMPNGTVVTSRDIGNIRFDRTNNTLYGVIRNHVGMGTGIVTCTGNVATNFDMFAKANWNMTEINNLETPIVTISKVNVIGNIARFTATLLGGNGQNVEFIDTNGKISTKVGTPYKTPYVVLGNLFGQRDLFVGYTYDEQNVTVAFEKTKDRQPFAA